MSPDSARYVQESKYLGGDLEHTHLVKGLDYSLLHKARSEIERTPAPVVKDDGIDEAFQVGNRFP